MISSEYGWKTEYIWSKTMREIDWVIRAIVDRNNLDKSFHAKLHNMEINIPKTMPKEASKTKITEDQEKAMERAYREAKARKASGK